jgi:hypothetical protein
MITFRFLSVLSSLIFSLHFAWSAMVVGILEKYYDHRILNVRKTKNVDRQWEDLTSSFTAEAIEKSNSQRKPLAMFIGSSVTYGYPWQERITYTKLVADDLKNWKISNLSVIGIGMRAMTDFVTCGLKKSRKPHMLFVEIPLVNSTSSISPGAISDPRECAKYDDGVPGYWPLVLSRPYGIAWVSILWDEESYEKPDSNLVISPLPPTYFADRQRFKAIEGQFVSELRYFLSEVSAMGEQVFVYVSPIYTPAISIAGGDRAAVEYQVELTNRVCKEYKKLSCLDSSVFSQRPELFYNLTHLNHRGHRALANWFEPYIASQSRPRPIPISSSPIN